MRRLCLESTPQIITCFTQNVEPTVTEFELTLTFLYAPLPHSQLLFFYYPSALCISFNMLKEWQTADGMEEGDVCVCVCVCLGVCVRRQEIGTV